MKFKCSIMNSIFYVLVLHSLLPHFRNFECVQFLYRFHFISRSTHLYYKYAFSTKLSQCLSLVSKCLGIQGTLESKPKLNVVECFLCHYMSCYFENIHVHVYHVFICLVFFHVFMWQVSNTIKTVYKL